MGYVGVWLPMMTAGIRFFWMDSGVGLVQVVSRKRMPRATALFMGYVFGVMGIVREDIGWGGKFRGFRSGLLL